MAGSGTGEGSLVVAGWGGAVLFHEPGVSRGKFSRLPQP